MTTKVGLADWVRKVQAEISLADTPDALPEMARRLKAYTILVESLVKITGIPNNKTVGLLLAGITVGAKSDTSGNECRQIARDILRELGEME